jgi:hypothetical protein
VSGDERADWLRELVPLLWPAPATVTLGRARHAGGRRSYLILPSLEHPRLLLPRRTRRAAGGAIRGYGEQSSPARRTAVRLASYGLVAGAGDQLLRDRLEVGGGGDTIEDHLARELGRPVLVSLHLGPARANRKPVLQLLGTDGATVGFAKVATTPLTGRRERVAALPAGDTRDELTGALDALRGTDVPLRIGSWHGDWTPWNTAVVADTVLAWDWERFTDGVPVGFDALHYDLQPRALGHVDAAGAAAADSVRRAPALLAPVGVPAGSAAVVAVLYLVEILTRYVGDGQTRWGNWRSMTEGVLAAARAAAPVAAR